MSSCLKMSNLHPMVTSVLLSYFDFFDQLWVKTGNSNRYTKLSIIDLIAFII